MSEQATTGVIIWADLPQRERDALVAEKVMGWRWMCYPAPNNPDCVLTGLFPPEAPNRMCVANGYDLVWKPSDNSAPRFSNWYTCAWWQDGELQRGIPRYTTDITAAWEVAERMTDHSQSDWCTFEMRRCTNWDDPTWGYDVRFGEQYNAMHQRERVAWARTAPLAICMAALKARGVEV